MKVYHLGWLIAIFALYFGACGSDGSPVGGFAGTDTITAAGTTGTGTASAGVTGQTTAGIGGQAAVNTSASGGVTGNATAGKTAVTGAKGGAGGKTGSNAAGATGKAGTGGGAVGAAGGSANSACVSALKKGCKFHSTDSCSSFTTKGVTGIVNSVEVKFGPYGATMDKNVGQEFALPENSQESSCDLVASSFGEPAEVTEEVSDLQDVDLTLYTVYRPACTKEGEKYPILTWGNGTCGQPEGYAALLRYIASHGYYVFAANSRWVGTNNAMIKALDFAFAANEDSKSKYYQKLDTTKVGAMGHSQGGQATVAAARDSRVKVAIIFNAAPPAEKPYMVFSGDRDIGGAPASSLESAVNSGAQPGAWLYYHKIPETGGTVTGHLTLMMQPDRVVEAATGWWNYMLKGDKKARDLFVGSGCGLCGKDADFEYGQKGLK